jgi:hypothetical protein
MTGAGAAAATGATEPHAAFHKIVFYAFFSF